MIYIIAFISLAAILFLLRRRMGIPLLAILVTSFLIGWWSPLMATGLRQLGVGITANRLIAWIEIIVVGGVSAVMIYKSATTFRHKTGRIVDAVMGSLTIVFLLCNHLGWLVGFDKFSLEIHTFLLGHRNLILTIVGVYALYETLGMER